MVIRLGLTWLQKWSASLAETAHWFIILGLTGLTSGMNSTNIRRNSEALTICWRHPTKITPSRLAKSPVRAPDLLQALRQTSLESLEDPVDENGW